MSRLAVAVIDFALPAEADSALRTPALDRLLTRGRLSAAAATGWRSWVLQCAGIEPPRRLPIAGTVAGRPGHWAIATPLSLLAGLQHVHLDPQGPPALDPAEWDALISDFNRTFGADGLRLGCEHGTGLLSLPRALDVETHDPLPLAGRDAGAWLPLGTDGGLLRRLMTEVQMWLHDWPVNDQRAARGATPVNALWFWGCGDGAVPVAGPLPQLASDDVFLRRLWTGAGQAPAPVPASPAALQQQAGARSSIVTLSLRALGPDPATAIEALDRDWMAPIGRLLADGLLQEAELLLAGSRISISRADRLRFWRRHRASQEALR